MRWDFAIILIFFATVVPILGRRRIRQLMSMDTTTKLQRLRLYASTILFQWVAVAIVLWRVHAHGVSMRALGIAAPKPLITAAIAVVLAALVFANQLFSIRRFATHPEETEGVLPQLALKIFPQDRAERVAFFALVVTVAICEELIFRGFAQEVFQSWARGLVIAGVLGSAVLFGLAHLYQGSRGFIATFVVGVVFSVIRFWTGSLLAPAIAHFVADFLAGLMAPSRLRLAMAQKAGQIPQDLVSK